MDATKERLHVLRQRLLAANLRSRSLRLSRTTRSGAFDLSRLEELNPNALTKLRDGLGEAKAFTTQLMAVRGTGEEERLASEDLRRLSNAAHRTWMEVGEDELLLGWPFIECKFSDTWLRAPLLLFPVTFKRSRRGRLVWRLTVEGRPDVNEVLIQALFRLGGVRPDLERLIEMDEDGALKPDDASWNGIAAWLTESGITLHENGEQLPSLDPVQKRDKEAREEYPDGRAELRNHLVLGRFPQSSSNILSEYNELEQRLELLTDSPAAELLAIDLDAEPEDFSLEELEEEAIPVESAIRMLTTSEDARILPSDASQEAVIRALEESDGTGLVVRGPPGTGKSQLISNLVGQAIHRNERILVVCQKRAALDVVAQRVGEMGLGEAIAVVHDIHHDRKPFTASIAASIEGAINVEEGGVLADRVRAEKAALAQFDSDKQRFQVRISASEAAYNAMMAPGPGGFPLAELFERALDDDGRELPDLSEVSAAVENETVIRTLPAIESLAPEAQAYAAPHPLAVRTDWAGQSEVSLVELRDQLKALNATVAKCGGVPDATLTPGDAAAHSALWEQAADLLDLFETGTSESQEQFALFWTFTQIGGDATAFDRLVARIEQAKELDSVPSGLYLASSERVLDWLAMLNELSELKPKWWRFILPKFWRLRKVPDAIIDRCVITGTMLPENVVADLVRLCERTLEWHRFFREVSELLEDAPIFDFGCSGQSADVLAALDELEDRKNKADQLRTIHRRLRGAHSDYSELPDFSTAVDYPGIPIIRAALADRTEYRHLSEAQELATSLHPSFSAKWLDPVLESAKKGTPDASRIDLVIESWDEATAVAEMDRRQAELPVWAREFLRTYQPKAQTDSTPLVSSFDSGALEADLYLALERSWRQQALGGSTVAQIESALVDETHRAGLESAYSKMVDSAAPAVAARFRQRLRRAAAQTKGVGRSLRQCLKDANKKRYRLSIRQFVERYWSQGLAWLRPVWLCSPESVAALFPLENGLFDRVVMDEASQCPVESALPAMIRGKRLVIAGDEKQMPPSHFFASRDDDDLLEDEEESALLSAQSILDVARIAYQGSMLRFHYRSKFEELITFSNNAFYAGGLVTAPPATITKQPYEGMHYEMGEGVWKDQVNRPEAERVVDTVLGLLAQETEDGTPPTVGIVTFNKKQRTLIEDLLDERSLDDEVARDLLAADRERSAIESLFVKNIENVQGDERDIIVFSVGYGPSADGGKVHARFGPVGQEGGENRLNVAITRAKRGVRVMSSFDPTQLDTKKTKNLGPKLFHSYLDYAQAVASGDPGNVNRSLGTLETLVEDQAPVSGEAVPPSRVGLKVRDELADRLESCGLEVARDFGIGPFKLDIALRNPSADSWACGVDCTQFLATRDAIRRDISTPFFWRRAGWRLVRVSPAMWLERKEDVVGAILEILEASSPDVSEPPKAGG